MEIRLTQYIKSFIITIGKKISVFLLLLLTINCTNNSEPAFSLKGDKSILKDVKVNVEMITSDGMAIASVFYNGQEYHLNNEGALRYNIYISYKDSLFHLYETDNLHGKLKGEPINEITIEQKDGHVASLYRVFKDSAITRGDVLLPAKDFFANAGSEKMDKIKQKFTGLYK